MATSTFTTNELVQRYEIILNPHASPQDRKAAENYIETLKCSLPFDAFMLGVALCDARNGNALHLRNLGLNLMESTARQSLSALPLQNQHLIRKAIWDLAITNSGALKTLESRLVVEKVASTLALVVIQLWLVEDDSIAAWNGFFAEDIEGLLTRPDGSVSLDEQLRRQQLGLLTVTHIVTLVRTLIPSGGLEISNNNSPLLSNTRRDQLLAGLELVLPSISNWILHTFPQVSAQERASPNMVHVILAALGLIETVLPWLNGLDPKGLEGFVTAAFQLLSEYPLDNPCIEPTLNALTALFSARNLHVSHERCVVERFLVHEIAKVGQLIQRLFHAAMSSFEDQDILVKIRSVLQILTLVTTRFVAHKKQPILPPESCLLELLLALIELPSISCYVDIVEAWTSVLRCRELEPKLPREFDNLVSALFVHLQRKLAATPNQERSLPLNRLEFEGNAREFRAVWSIGLSRSLECLGSIAGIRPVMAMNLCYQSLGTFIQTSPQAFTARKLEGALSLVRQWSAILSSLEQSLKIANPSDIVDVSVQCLRLLCVHVPVPQDPQILVPLSDAVKALACSLGEHAPQDDFYRAVERFFALVAAPSTSFHIRGKLISALIAMAESSIGSFAPFADGLIAALTGQLDTSTWSSIETNFLFEFILLLATSLPLASNKLQLLQIICDPITARLKEAQMVLLSCPDPTLALMKAIGFDFLRGQSSSEATVTDSNSLWNTISASRSTLANLLSNLHFLIRRVKGHFAASSPELWCELVFRNVLMEAVPFMMILAGALHGLGRASLWHAFFGGDLELKAFKELLLPTSTWRSTENDDPEVEQTEEEKVQSSAAPMQATKSRHFESSLMPGTISRFLAQSSSWLKNLRHNSYISLGLAVECGPQVLAATDFVNGFMTLALSNLDGLRLEDWFAMLKMLLTPILGTLMTGDNDKLVKMVVKGLLAIVVPMIDLEWKLLTTSPQNASADEDSESSLLKEVAREAVLIGLSSQLIKLLNELCATKDEIIVDIKTCIALDQLLPNLGKGKVPDWFIRADLDTLREILGFVGIAFKWPRPSIGYGRFLGILQALQAVLMGHPEIGLEEKEVFASAIASMLHWALLEEGSFLWRDHSTGVGNVAFELHKWSLLLLAESRLGFETIHVKSPQYVLDRIATQMTSCERAFNLQPNDALSFRAKLVGDAGIKSQRQAFKALILRLKGGFDEPKPELTRRLQALKKERLLKQQLADSAPGDPENFLGNLFE